MTQSRPSRPTTLALAKSRCWRPRPRRARPSMATQRDIKRRIGSVQNTKKITKAMEMVAAARLRRAQDRIEATRPYAERMMEFIAGMARYVEVDPERFPLLKVHEDTRRVAVVALTADRGLCGACLLYTSPSPRDRTRSRMPSSA